MKIPFYANGTLTRAEAVAIAGESAVRMAERETCECTSRCMPDGAECSEWVSRFGDVSVWYYIDDDTDTTDEDGEPIELDQYPWKIQGYTVD